MKPGLPLNSLRAFEVAARYGSFKLAAAELGVSQPAVSRQVALLESWIGMPLFKRSNRRVLLTPEGAMLMEQISFHLRHIEAAVLSLRQAAPSIPVAIDVPPTFAVRWLIPRLPTFMRANPEVDVRISTSIEMPSFNSGRFDIIIRRTDAVEAGIKSQAFLSELMVPVCCPEIAEPAQLSNLRSLEEQTLIYTASAPEAWPNWLQAVGCEEINPAKTISFETMNYAIEAAINGLGVAIIPAALVVDEIARGDLLVPFPVASVERGGYKILRAAGASGKGGVSALISWLIREAESTTAMIADLLERPIEVRCC